MQATANIYKEKGYYRVVLNVGSVKLINAEEICFDRKNLIIRHPTIYDNKVYKISTKKVQNAAFAFTLDVEPYEDILGKYLIEKEGDDFLLLKQNPNDQTNN